MDVAATTDASPVIVYVRLRKRSSEYRYVTWEDGKWEDRHVCTTPLLLCRSDYPAGLTIDHRDPRVIYVSRKRAGRFGVEAWATADDGETWAREPLTTSTDADSFRPTSALLGSAVLWMTGKYTQSTASAGAATGKRAPERQEPRPFGRGSESKAWFCSLR